MSKVEFVVRDEPGGKRVAVEIEVRDESGQACFTGQTKPSTADMRDHLWTFLPRGHSYRVLTRLLGMSAEAKLETDTDRILCTLFLRDRSSPVDPSSPGARSSVDGSSASPGRVNSSPVASVPTNRGDEGGVGHAVSDYGWGRCSR
jgi:hypothetical protein